MTEKIDFYYTHHATPASHLYSAARDMFLRASQTLRTWYERRKQRRWLFRLDDRLLRDIGIDKVTAMQEAAKPFWRE